MGESFAERVSEAVASGMGSVPFIVCSTAIIIGWICLNAFEATRTIHALTRRCLQHFLEAEVNAKERDPLEKQIQTAIALSPPDFLTN